MKYDHQALERHILNRFIHGKPLILLEIPQVVYRKDIYTTDTFADVRKKVAPQVMLRILLNLDSSCCVLLPRYHTIGDATSASQTGHHS